MPRFDETFSPHGAPLNNDEIKRWDPVASPAYVQRELRRLDLSGDLARPIIIMPGTADPVYYIPGMAHGGIAYDDMVPAQIEALEAWIDYRQSGGKVGAPVPERIGIYSREPDGPSRLNPVFK
ncbi:MAG: hypothetical protein ABI672_09945 [Vicinamibacteria bacterium]